MRKVVLASGNQGKLRELQSLLATCDLDLLSQADFDLETPEETGLTFVENALIKARYVADKTGLPAIADDSGLAVRALNGAPGIYSARYAGEGSGGEKNDRANLEKLLNNMQDVSDDARQACFHCVLVYLQHAADPTPIICHGQWHGQITREPAGENGFGYDPVFWVPQQNCTSAQLQPDQKNSMSHRGKALQALVQAMHV